MFVDDTLVLTAKPSDIQCIINTFKALLSSICPGCNANYVGNRKTDRCLHTRSTKEHSSDDSPEIYMTTLLAVMNSML